MEAFKTTWHSSEMQELWARTKTEGFSQGTDTWRVNYRNQVEDWKKQEKGFSSPVEQPATVEEDPRDVIEKFKTKHPRLKLEPSHEETLWPLTLTVTGMSFEIDKQAADDAKIYLLVAKAGKRFSNFQQDIVRVVQQRKPQDSLAYLMVR